jgi:hypothetical protein
VRSALRFVRSFEWSAVMYFGSAIVFFIACIVLIIQHRILFNSNQKKFSSNPLSFIPIMKKLNLELLTVYFNFAITLVMFPGMTAAFVNEQLGDWYPVILIVRETRAHSLFQF